MLSGPALGKTYRLILDRTLLRRVYPDAASLTRRRVRRNC
jgi:hypothetical protein